MIADAQTGGRGRLGRLWHSPPGGNLYFSTVLRPPLPPHRAPPLTLAAAVALAETVEEAGAEPELKWPNDLLLDGKKAAGILTEMVTSGGRVEHVVLGVGVNLCAGDLPQELADRATSLAAIAGREIAREPFAASLCARIERWHDRFLDEGVAPVVAAWKRRARLFGRTVTVASGRETLAGVAVDLDADGTLLLLTDDGRRVRVMAGEIT